MTDNISSDATAATSTSTITANSAATETKKPEIKIEKKPDNHQRKNWWHDKNKLNKIRTIPK